MLLHLTDLSPEPLHEQISRQIRAQILSGDLDAGAQLPSIRGLARDQKVSVITVQRAYDDLLREGLLLARRGKGLFVAALDQAHKRDLAVERVANLLRPAIAEARAQGLSATQIQTLVRKLLQED